MQFCYRVRYIDALARGEGEELFMYTGGTTDRCKFCKCRRLDATEFRARTLDFEERLSRVRNNNIIYTYICI